MNDEKQNMQNKDQAPDYQPSGPLAALIHFSLHNKLLVFILFLTLMLGGIYYAPFDWNIPHFSRDPVPVDAIPDIGENQQIVFTSWEGRSPEDVENQITYPLTVSLMGLPGVKTVRSVSMTGYSTIYVIFRDDIDFYWSRTRILEKLNSLPANLLPDGVKPALGPDASALGQVFWYTIEGRDSKKNPTGGWDLDEIRSVQDWNVRYALLGVEGVSEVASIGGFVKEYQIDIDPAAMKEYKISLEELANAVRRSNSDVGARTLEINRVEYIIRGLGYVRSIKDIEDTVVKSVDGVPVYVKNLARVSTGPAERRGMLDKGGAEVVGGVVVVRYGENPLKVIKSVKNEIRQIAASLPSKTLADGTVSKLEIVPFYDRTGLIYETLETLNAAIFEEIIICSIVVIMMLRHLRVSLLISMLLPASVLMSFILMRYFGVDANIVALGGIAIAIGEIADVGIVLCENIVKRLDEAKPGEKLIDVVYRGASEVAGAVLTSVSTTIVSFLPVFSLQYAEGKLFKPLAYTKTFTMAASIIIAIILLPPLVHVFLARPNWRKNISLTVNIAVFAACVYVAFSTGTYIIMLAGLFPLYWTFGSYLPQKISTYLLHSGYVIAALLGAWFLSMHWMPLGVDAGDYRNFVFVLALLLFFFMLFQFVELSYRSILRFVLNFKIIGFAAPLLMIFLGLFSWLGAAFFIKFMPGPLADSKMAGHLVKAFPGLGSEFIPALDEGSFLFMPTMMPHASVTEVRDILAKQDILISAIPELDSVVGKAGRAESPLDPAPLNMVETVINYHNKYLADSNGHYLKFKYLPDENETFKNSMGVDLPAPDGKPYIVKGRFVRDESGHLIPDANGHVFRQWRPALDPALNSGREAWNGVQSPDDIWTLIVSAAAVPGSTSAPKLQPIQTRIVMLQSGMRASMGMVIRGPDIETIETAADMLAAEMKKSPYVNHDAVIVDRFSGKPYIEIKTDRAAIARYGISLGTVQDAIEMAVGGMSLSTTVEGRERYSIRVRYQREMRDDIESLKKIYITSPDGMQIPLGQLASFHFRRGPQEIKSENSFKIAYVFFDKAAGLSESESVERLSAELSSKIAEGKLKLPDGVSYRFSGNYENQIRAAERLAVIIPMALLIILVIIYFQFRKISVSLFVFSGIAVAWAGGFFMIWLYGVDSFMNFSLMGVNLRDLFNIHQINMSVAVWVGFLALFGIATDDGIVMATYIEELFQSRRAKSIAEIKDMVIEAGKRRVRPCLMTTATTVLALLPVFTASGKGAEIMIPMAIPVFGGMVFQIITMFTVPQLYCLMEELKFRFRTNKENHEN